MATFSSQPPPSYGNYGRGYGNQNHQAITVGPSQGLQAQRAQLAAYSGDVDIDHKANTIDECGRVIRLGFIRKVYSILVVQLAFTASIASIFMFSESVQTFAAKNYWIQFLFLILTFVLIYVLFKKRDQYPTNMILFAVFTLLESLSIGFIVAVRTCAEIQNDVCVPSSGGRLAVLQAFLITIGLFICLTAYTFQSKRDFSRMGGFLFGGLICLVLWGIFIALFGAGFVTYFIFALFGALLFCGYIIYDTFNITKRLGPDDYILGALSLYLDIVNLFLFILALLGMGNND